VTNEQINAAIDEVYGWQADYCGDLNAMHEVEKSISDELWDCYFNQLARVTKAEQSDDRVFFCATARERAEAFLRVMGKWEEVAK
jgi:hypothetical protein